MFYVLFLFCVTSGLCLGVWLSMRHAELYDRLLKTSENSTIASIGDVSNTYYDTEQVNEVEANSEENLDGNLSLQEALVTEEANISPDHEFNDVPETKIGEESSTHVFNDPIVEELESNPPLFPDAPGDLHEEATQTVPVFEADMPIQDQEEAVTSPGNTSEGQEFHDLAPVVEIISELLDISSTWSDSKVVEETIEMVSRESLESKTPDSYFNETQNMMVEFENSTPDVVETHWISNAGDAKYVNRVICRPRLGS